MGIVFQVACKLRWNIRRKGVQAKTVGPQIMSRTKYITPCTPFRLFPTCKSALVGAVLRNVKFILVCYVGIYTGHLCCIVKLPRRK